jgi:hypothetical protein
VDPYGGGSFTTRSLCEADVVGVSVGQYHGVEIVQATSESVEVSEEQLPVARCARIDKREGARLFDQVEVGNSACQAMYPWRYFG